MNTLAKKLSYISKSKKNTYDSCPLSFKFGYIDKIPQASNPAFVIGTDVHDFIENFFKIVEIGDDEVRNISKLKYYPNLDYKKNFVKFELERWDKIKNAGKDGTFFFPVANEEKYITENPKMIGIVDRIHKCCKEDPFASEESDFEDGDLVIVENKTGIPTKKKCEGYRDDMIWYKILAEISKPELSPIKWSAIYFPKDNHVAKYRITASDCKRLAKDIDAVRDKILSSLESGEWKATPSPQSCMWCGYKHLCKYKHV